MGVVYEDSPVLADQSHFAIRPLFLLLVSISFLLLNKVVPMLVNFSSLLHLYPG